MNHDYAHCLDYTENCPKDCFRAELQRDIEETRSEFIGVPMAYSHLGSTVECKLVMEKKMDHLIRRQDAIDCVTVGAKPTTIRGRIAELPSAQSEWNNHTVACMLAELFDDTCACNYNGIDEWLPLKCELLDSCPHSAGVACWEQYLTHRAERRDG